MPKLILPLLAALVTASLGVASPALADEARVEMRGGVLWVPGQSEATAGVAAGYDFDLGSHAFTGVEVSADKALASGYKTAFGFSGRAGIKAGDTKLYGITGYTTEPCDNCNGAWHLGAGVEHRLAGPVYGKVEYRHLFGDKTADSNAVAAGVGVKF